MLTFALRYFIQLSLIFFLNNTFFNYLVKKIQPSLYYYDILAIYRYHSLYIHMFVSDKFFIF